MMTEREYSLDDLVHLTGFSRRQIRFYINKKLVPGAEDRGPHAVYSHETLARLRLIAKLKATPVPPLNRTMTLDEMRDAIETLPPESLDALLSGAAELRVFDTQAGRPVDRTLRSRTERPAEDDPGTAARSHPAATSGDAAKASGPPAPDTASAYLRDLRAQLDGHAARHEAPASSVPCVVPLFSHPYPGERREPREPDDPVGAPAAAALTDVLQRLQQLLADLAAQEPDARPTPGEAAPWRRLTTPDLEIHVRQPDDHRARRRLRAMARALARALHLEEGET